MASRRKATPAERAKQFMPFASLRGYYDYILEQEDKDEQRRELGDDECRELSEKLSRIERGMVIRAVHYRCGKYVETAGRVDKVDFTFRRMLVGDQRIWFDDIAELYEITDNSELLEYKDPSAAQ